MNLFMKSHQILAAFNILLSLFVQMMLETCFKAVC